MLALGDAGRGVGGLCVQVAREFGVAGLLVQMSGNGRVAGQAGIECGELRECGARTVRLPHGHTPIQPHHGCVGEPEEFVVPFDDL